ncbi:MAG: DUF1918 domain-containing protein [Cellulomonas sp.]|uniref:DUF1918 domain-containing protein n=1 Tax=Cellulomonas sp. TaxID=40001 RepID=UPI001825EB3C|nr:DUF1918 domain-containing protein [Cellulomonas sp.]NMM29998.1 DUF1918 domain-containing protein [Cellulomonas sp.]
MHASVGDEIIIHGRVLGTPSRRGEVLEAHGPDGTPPYLVKFDDGHETLVFPGPDVEIVTLTHEHTP